MIAAKLRSTAAQLREWAHEDMETHCSDERARIMSRRLRMLAVILEADARQAEHMERAVLTPAARAGLSVVTGGDAA